jgi:creatinine amidohydrolase
VQAALENGYDTAIIPLGATEQHGPHLPAGTDTFRAEALAARLAVALGRALIAPVIPIGCSEEHRGFAGTLSLRHETLAAILVDVGDSLARQGFRRLVFLSAHGGNGRALAMAVEELQRTKPEMVIWRSGSLAESVEMALTSSDHAGIDPAEAGIHAGERETSEMLALRPDLVDMARAEPGYTGDMAAVLPTLQTSGVRPVSHNGVLGDPRRASAERGAFYLELTLRTLGSRSGEMPGLGVVKPVRAVSRSCAPEPLRSTTDRRRAPRCNCLPSR